jgi:hypothetical protein
MKSTIASLLACLLISGAAPSLSAKGVTAKIIIIGETLNGQIEIADPGILAHFNIWAGPGASSNEAQGLIVDWSQGKISAPPRRLPLYEVFFYEDAGNHQQKLAYVVSYKYDPSTGQGYVYVPGRAENWYGTNVGTIIRGVEGSWFHAWSAWQEVAAPRIAKAKLTVASS